MNAGAAPAGWRETYKRRPRVAYLRIDGAAIIGDGPGRKWSICASLGSRPLSSAKAIDEATQRLEVKYDREMGPMPAGMRNDYRFFAVQIATRWRKWHAVVAESG